MIFSVLIERILFLAILPGYFENTGSRDYFTVYFKPLGMSAYRARFRKVNLPPLE
jgi:hypothetical protein